MRVAAAIALFAGGAVAGRWSTRPGGTEAKRQMERPSLAIQTASSQYIHALAYLSSLSSATDQSTQEVAASSFRGIAAELGRLDPSGMMLTRVQEALLDAQAALPAPRGGL